MRDVQTVKIDCFHQFWVCAALTLATVAVFYQVCTHDFVNCDDPGYIYNNPNIQAGITLKAIEWAFTTGYACFWHPLTWLSHMLDWQLFGSNPAGHHLTNLIFHIANTLLLFVVLKQMTGAMWQSAFVAALFALHPLHVESVAWVAERKDVLSIFFWLLTMWAYVRFANHPKITSYLMVVVLFALGLMAKPMLVTLPFVLLLLDYWPLERFNAVISPKRKKVSKKYSLAYLFIEKIPLFAMVLASCIVALIAQKKGGAIHTGENYTFLIRLANASISYLQYIIKMIWPTRLAFFYPHPGQNVSILYAAISGIFLLTITTSILRFAKERRYLVTGWLWYLGTLVPVIGFVQVGEHAMADRYSYITLTGLFIIIAWGLPDLLAKWRYKKIVLTLSALLIILAMTICTHLQLRYWRNSLTLFQRALDVTKDNYMAHFCIAKPLRKQGRLDEAIYHYSEVIRLRPDHFDAQITLAYALRDTGRLDEAIREYRKCLQMEPNDPNALNGLGVTLGQQGKLDQAVKCFTEALRIKPDSAEAHTNLGFVLTLQGSLDEAAVHLGEALRLDTNSEKAHYYLGQILAQRGKIDEAITHFEESLRLKPDWAEPMNDLAWFLAASKETAIHNPDKALRLAQRACELTNYSKPELLDTLAVAYAAAGSFSKAIETAEKALELCRSPKQKTLKDE
ncbi:MAG: tetratricopeptide repeat protein, partial [Sedimentisphaerales bacterium]|nr:tetratricopeptide repeat protein [Sedimentisphaerales bacterium]